jgi:hypothetical protein
VAPDNNRKDAVFVRESREPKASSEPHSKPIIDTMTFPDGRKVRVLDREVYEKSLRAATQNE